jgi:hypothetical protein
MIGCESLNGADHVLKKLINHPRVAGHRKLRSSPCSATLAIVWGQPLRFAMATILPCVLVEIRK